MMELELADWRRAVFELYAAVRNEISAASAHALWRGRRDELFREHPQSPLAEHDPLRDTGLPYWAYDPRLRFQLPLIPMSPSRRLSVETGGDGTTRMWSIGAVELPPPVDARVGVWWLDQYAGGLFLPVRDGTAGDTTYGGGRYLLDTAKGADLGGTETSVIIDLNFLYHPSCRYNDRWQCPLAPAENTFDAAIPAGERL